MKATRFFDMWENTYPAMQRHIPEYTNPHYTAVTTPKLRNCNLF